MIKWLSQYGEVVAFRNEHYRSKKTGKRTKWKVGARVGMIKLHSFNRTVPPRTTMIFDNRRVEVSIYHYGQSEGHCRTCRKIMPKEHDCNKQDKRRRCFNCQSEDHMKRDCPKGKTCHHCKKIGHFAKDCPDNNRTFSAADFPGVEQQNQQKVNGAEATSGQKRNASQIQSPEQNVTSETTHVSTNADIHADNEGFTFDRNQRKRLRRALRRDPKHASTPVSSPKTSQQDEIELLSTETRTSPTNKKLSKTKLSLSKLWKQWTGGATGGATGGETEPDKTNHMKSKEPETTGEQEKGEKTIIHSSTTGINKEKVNGKQEITESSEDTVQIDTIDLTADEGHIHPNGVDGDIEPQEASTTSTPDSLDKDELNTGNVSEQCNDDDIHNHEIDLYSIGASNFTGLTVKGDADLRIAHKNHSVGGLSIFEVPERVDNIPPEERENIKLLVTNVGSVDFEEEGDNDAQQIYDDYAEMLAKVNYLCPYAKIIVSSIIPRRGDDMHRKVNKDILDVNTMLFENCKDSESFHFCDNSEVVFDEFHQIKNSLYKDEIHLNPEGRRDLAKSVFRKAKEIYFQHKMCPECAEDSSSSPGREGEDVLKH